MGILLDCLDDDDRMSEDNNELLNTKYFKCEMKQTVANGKSQIGYSNLCNVRKLVEDRLQYWSSIDQKFKDIYEMVKTIKVKLDWDKLNVLGFDEAGSYDDGEILINEILKGKITVFSVVLHELIHAIGGNELDAEFFEWVCCKDIEGRSEPCCGDYDKFYYGTAKFVKEVTGKTLTDVTTKFGTKTLKFQFGQTPKIVK